MPWWLILFSGITIYLGLAVLVGRMVATGRRLAALVPARDGLKADLQSQRPSHPLDQLLLPKAL
jgi:hypothetical protein